MRSQPLEIRTFKMVFGGWVGKVVATSTAFWSTKIFCRAKGLPKVSKTKMTFSGVGVSFSFLGIPFLFVSYFLVFLQCVY